jgi:NAD(P)-dependent dehydrogenase (short-subunit alcohol dehydrogenase family)
MCQQLTLSTYSDILIEIGTMPKTIVITGASDGIGAAAARELSRKGHEVVVVGRSPQKTRAVAGEIGARSFVADFTRLDEVRKLAADLDAGYSRIDVLANNAGGVFGDRVVTADGFELTFQINHLAPFLLTHLLLDKLIASKASVIQTSSVGARMAGRLKIEDLNLERGYNPVLAYGTAKLENILFTRELHRRYNARGVSAAAFHPGNVNSSFGKQSKSLIGFIARTPILHPLLSIVSPEQGAEQLLWLAETMPSIEWASGMYYEKHRPATRENPQAKDPELARQLWERSERMLGL